VIVFDLDGTLIDSWRDLAASANALIIERGGQPLPEGAIASMVGEGAALLVRRALTAAGLTTEERSVPRFLELYDQRLLRTTRPYPGIPEVIRKLAGDATVAVLTNKPLAPTLKLLKAFDLSSVVVAAIGGDGPFPRKPDPTALRRLMSWYGASPRQTVMVGDSRIDFETARAAESHICLTRYGFGYAAFPLSALRGDEALVDRPEDLPRALERLLDKPR
jgi:phosphoglycolate phosphatase